VIEMTAYTTFPGWSREYVRKGISYVNLIHLLKSIVPYRSPEEKGDKKAENDKPKNTEKRITHFEQFGF